LEYILDKYAEVHAVEDVLDALQQTSTQQLQDTTIQLHRAQKQLELLQKNITVLQNEEHGIRMRCGLMKGAVRKQSFIDDIQRRTLLECIKNSDVVLNTTFDTIDTLHGKKATPFVFAQYIESHLTDSFLKRVVDVYKGGLLIRDWECKLRQKIHHKLDTIQATDLIDRVSGINFTGFLEVMNALRDTLPPKCLPTRRGIEDIRDKWGTEMALILDLKPTIGEGGCGPC
jgi:hypothetical protein